MKLKYFIVGLLVAMAQLVSTAATLTFEGSAYEVIAVKPEASTGLEMIYVLRSTQGVKAYYSYSGQAPTWSEYSNLGGGYARPLTDVVSDGSRSVLNNVPGDRGIIVEDGGRQYCFWIVDYSAHACTLQSVAPSAEQMCGTTSLDVVGSASAIHYYTVDGRQRILSREMEVEYQNQEYNEDNNNFETVHKLSKLEYIDSKVTLTPPIYCTTDIEIRGDRFLKQWGQPEMVDYNGFTPQSVAVRTSAKAQEKTTGDSTTDEDYKSNQITSNTSGLGGSAPADIVFTADCTEGVIHNEWQMSTDPDFENITYRINERDLEYTFEEEGTTYIRFVGSNSDGSCEDIGETYTVTISESELKCPNAFSPGASPGVNDEWKVSYRSIIDFECWIFDRYGNEIFHFTDPEQGWDGKRGGKLVKPGVYFYVVQATGADGKKYKKSGDINILRYKTYSNSNE